MSLDLKIEFIMFFKCCQCLNFDFRLMWNDIEERREERGGFVRTVARKMSGKVDV